MHYIWKRYAWTKEKLFSSIYHPRERGLDFFPLTIIFWSFIYIFYFFFWCIFQENGINVTHVYNQSFVDVTWFRTHPHYQTYLNWSQSLVLGFIPVALLIYYNGRIYMDIRYDNYDISVEYLDFGVKFYWIVRISGKLSR